MRAQREIIYSDYFQHSATVKIYDFKSIKNDDFIRSFGEEDEDGENRKIFSFLSFNSSANFSFYHQAGLSINSISFREMSFKSHSLSLFITSHSSIMTTPLT